MVASNSRIRGRNGNPWQTRGDEDPTETRPRRLCTLPSDDVVRVTPPTRQMSLPRGTRSLDDGNMLASGTDGNSKARIILGE
jgi:hypothetical protein